MDEGLEAQDAEHEPVPADASQEVTSRAAAGIVPAGCPPSTWATARRRWSTTRSGSSSSKHGPGAAEANGDPRGLGPLGVRRR